MPHNEIFSNGGFEQWILDTLAAPFDSSLIPHSFWFGKHTKGVPDSLFVKEGKYALCQIPDSLGDSLPVVSGVYQDVKIKPERFYQFSGWVKKEDTLGNKVSLTIKWFSSNYRLLREDSSEVLSNVDDSYQSLSTGILKSPEQADFARLGCEVLAYEGSVLWDDLSFSEIEGVKETITSSDRVQILLSLTRRSIEIKCPNGLLSVELYNCLGTLVEESSSSRNSSLKIDLSHLPNGIYFCHIFLNNQPITIKKLVLLR